MAAFSYQYQYQYQQPPFMNLHDSVPNNNNNFQTSDQMIKTSAVHTIDESNINPTNSCFPHKFYQTNNDHSFTNKTCTDSSSITDKLESTDHEQVIQKVTSSMINKKRKSKDPSASNSANAKKKNNMVMKDQDEEKKPKENKKDRKKASEEAPSGYIHVRARRGQATDSHSLAERVRREKISERMKLLQALVPGCDKVTGKALMLDEIINYVQSLQNQVEFLSMKLASLSPVFYDFGMDLDSFMVRPNDQRLGNLAPSLQNVLMISDTSNALPTANNYSQLDNSASILFQQSQIAQIFSQGNEEVLWEVDEQRQKLNNQTGLTSNLCSFH